MESLENIFKALSDRNRLRILKMLEVRPLCNCEVQAILGLAPSTVSKHLSILCQIGLIIGQKQGKWMIYHLPTVAPELHPIQQVLANWGKEDQEIAADKLIASQTNNRLNCQG
ncbi:MAG: hypothetical protein A2508_05710 [Candidatus Lambdaproteobacteria bacterium RIFOXYD12_FULL_49_8]|uniref:HTH arsR-type domain-containing protein n=1 Tax=Candidatus Lambdaproteobacteria bacterium RIFOXYD2_FULL_50_16 TaxID=1817772 RepID=A0A1F6G7G0_9PROT|nr:MAG: hypothetical protein A2527_09305 [Candidatus Lambdaproteobacteria bacterium RIFOXYD2_FULL_50_16]OGG98408.1 MAG: hypothetical protein A2508_05710 [Candidatus Lambdaproteobacteria bacterium RIFOXYD12_FULL_49_8]